MQTVAGLATHPLVAESRRDHCAVLSYLKALLINKLLRCAIVQLSHRKVAVYCSAEYFLLTYFSFLLQSVLIAVT